MLCFAIVGILALITTTEAAEKRTWTDKTGTFTLEAEFVKTDETDKNVTLLRSDGKEVTLSIDFFSDKDAEYIQSQSRKRSATDSLLPLANKTAGENQVTIASTTGKRRALLIGVNEYLHLNPLKYPGNDVIELGKSLITAGFDPDHVVVMHDQAERAFQPDRNKIRKQISLLVEATKPEDLVFFVFAGHGVRIAGQSYLAPCEAEIPQAEDDAVALRSFIPQDWVYEQLEACPAKTKLIFVDACQENLFGTRSLAISRSITPVQVDESRLKTTATGNMLQLTACAPDELSYESGDLKHGVYTYFLIEGFSGKADANGDGVVTLKELDMYATDKTQTYVREHFRKTQRPSLKGTLIGDITLAEAGKLPNIVFPKEISDLHQAVARLADGGVLTIHPGVHRIAEPLIIDRDIQIVGSTGDPKDVTIESSGEGCLILTAENARIQGLTLQVKTGKKAATAEEREKMSKDEAEAESKRRDGHSAVRILSGKSTMSKCSFTSDAGSGVLLTGEGTNPSLERCKIFGCGGAGIKMADQSKAGLIDCESYENAYAGIQVGGKSNPTVTTCKFYDGKQNGIYVYENGKGTFEKCEAHGNTFFGILVQNDGDPKVTDCKAYDNKQAGIMVSTSGKGTFDGCAAYRNEIANFAVDSEGNPIVRNGKFYDGKQGGILVRKSGKGTFENCEAHGNTFSGILVRDAGDPKVTDGKFYDNKQAGIFVCESGKGTFDGCAAYRNEMANFGVESEGNPIVRNGKFYDGKQIGIFVHESGKGTFENCEMYGNALSGIQVSEEGDPKVIGCKFYDGKTSGILVGKSGKGTFENCEAHGNALAGIAVRENGDPKVTGCKVYDNKQVGIGVIKKGQGTFERNTLYGNAGGNWVLDDPGPIRRVGNTDDPPSQAAPSSPRQVPTTRRR